MRKRFHWCLAELSTAVQKRSSHSRLSKRIVPMNTDWCASRAKRSPGVGKCCTASLSGAGHPPAPLRVPKSICRKRHEARRATLREQPMRSSSELFPFKSPTRPATRTASSMPQQLTRPLHHLQRVNTVRQVHRGWQQRFRHPQHKRPSLDPRHIDTCVCRSLHIRA